MAAVKFGGDLANIENHRYQTLVKTFGKEVADEIVARDSDEDDVELDSDVKEIVDNDDSTFNFQ